MKLVELARRWRNNEITETEFEKEVPSVKIFKMLQLEDETDDAVFISNNGDSWDEVQDEVFGLENESEFFEFREKFSKAKKGYVMNNYIIHLLNFEVDTTELELFNKVGDENFNISINTEEGTLEMAVGHLKVDYSHVKIFEIYKDQQSYDIHRASEQFSHYIETVGHVILKRDMVDLEAKFMLENAVGTTSYEKGNLVEIKTLKVKENFEQKLRLLENEFREKILNNENILSFYLMKEKTSQTWYLYKVSKKDKNENVLSLLEDEIIETKITMAENDNTVSKGNLGK